MEDPERLAIAEAVAAEAGREALRAFRDGVGAVRVKRGPHDLVTETDERIERSVAAALAERFPADGMVGEEATSDRPSASGITWTVDPVDGTWNFAAGLPHWCVVVACADAAGPLAGAIADPLRDELWSAVRGGGGLRCNGAPAPPRPVRAMGSSTWAAALGPRFADPRWQRLRGRIGPIRMMGSLALDLAWTAAGRYDAFAYSCSLNPWDVWAGQVMAREQGLDVHAEPEERLLTVLPGGWWEDLGLGAP
ncbi:MAG: inositol monophosphatase family protein [Solirubrobacteraceae bacterium]|nr:inositol monophosphatase family protein [Solirubrobacteraceae bacterium]